MRSPYRAGFSLIEVLVVVAVATTIVFVVSGLSSNINLLNGFVSQQLQSKSDITQTLQIMTTEIRSAETSANGSYPLDVAATSTFSFYSDINKNGSAEHVRYFLSSSTIYKGVIAPTGTPANYPTATEVVTDVVDNIILTTSTPLFQYYDTLYSGTQQPLSYPITIANIRLVGINFAADVKPQQAPGPQYFSQLIEIRNLRSN